ncbi:MAG: non-canonical purine NTP pyrophosphatase, RdgB/HAM1 family [Omnitrophica WOR_2 bacterium RIFCSPLOWO2_01_FULL_41_12]|nr:MAG: non-canonical purine NTP pyrophosphatase, RdgB/HAM1 family [Omnitrophica WOR_2 bacterium RIFCSPLOWO2_01_FULL_41_12]
MELVVATKNKKKLKEIKEILEKLNLKITSLADYPQPPRIIENGRTFKANAIKKAVKIAHFTQKLTLGEDSGLEVDALGGKPGVYSSRFSGKDKNDLKNNLKILRLLEGLPLEKRRAHYYCAVALADKDGLVAVTEGKCSGRIGFALKGKLGFGYDPLFIIPKYKKTFAELGPRIKHQMSHRYKALTKINKILATYQRINPSAD